MYSNFYSIEESDSPNQISHLLSLTPACYYRKQGVVFRKVIIWYMTFKYYLTATPGFKIIVGLPVPIIHRKHKIIKKFIADMIDNHIAKEENVSREYVRRVRLKFQSAKVMGMLDQCETSHLRFPPVDYINYKFLIDAKLVKVASVNFQKITSLTLTPLGKEWLDWLRTHTITH